MQLKGKSAVITGASRGIGRAIALLFATEGAKTLLAARNISALQKVKAEILEARGSEPLLMQVDVTKEVEVDQMLDKALDNYGGVDILVNNAGVTRDGLVVRMSESEWDEVLNTNLKGTFFATKVASRIMMRQRRGKIINIASVIALIGNVGQSNYAASKAGVVALTKCVAKELAPRNVQVNAIAPGFIETDMTKNLSDAVKSEILRAIPVKRFGSVQDVAQTALYLASDASNYVTGQVITVDGGMVMS